MRDIIEASLTDSERNPELRKILTALNNGRKQLTSLQKTRITIFLQKSICGSCTGYVYAKLKGKTIEFNEYTMIMDKVGDVWCNTCQLKRMEASKTNPNLDNYEEIKPIDGDISVGIWLHLWKYHPDLFLASSS